jgi:hypothetical protein
MTLPNGLNLVWRHPVNLPSGKTSMPQTRPGTNVYVGSVSYSMRKTHCCWHGCHKRTHLHQGPIVADSAVGQHAAVKEDFQTIRRRHQENQFQSHGQYYWLEAYKLPTRLPVKQPSPSTVHCTAFPESTISHKSSWAIRAPSLTCMIEQHTTMSSDAAACLQCHDQAHPGSINCLTAAGCWFTHCQFKRG